MGLDISIGFLHEIASSKYPLVYDFQELFRYVIDYSVLEMLESGLKKSDFITTENYHTHLKPDIAKKLIKKITENFNQRYDFKKNKYTLENIMFENVREFSKYILGKYKLLDFNIPRITVSRNYTVNVRGKITSIGTRKEKP